MCLTRQTLHRLKAKDFHALYRSSPKEYADMAMVAVNYLKITTRPGEKALLGDVAEILKKTVADDLKFERHLDENGLAADSWAADFADYILEQVYPQRDL
jgi:hypothetical protein